MTQSDSPLSRIGATSETPEDEILADMFGRIRARRRPILNIHRVVGLAPKLLRAQAAYASSLRDESSLPRDLQEVLILRIAQVNNSAYEQSVHRPVAAACGVTPQKIAAVAAWRDSKLFDARERAALAYVEQAAVGGEVDEATFAATRQHFSPQEMIELTALIGWYVGNSRFVRALRILVEKEQN